MSNLWPIPEPVLLPIAGADYKFPVRRVYCVGRNYLAHAREMGTDEREPPFFFTKFADAIIPSGGTIDYPPRTANFHYEGELVIAIGKKTLNASKADAVESIFAYAGGLDMTRRDLQLDARDKGRPWDMGKNFSEAGIVGKLQKKEEFGDELSGRTLRLSVNGDTKQETDLALMIWSCAEIVAELSSYDVLMPGDLIFTGTPAGVGPVSQGDRIKLTVDGLPPCEIEISA